MFKTISLQGGACPPCPPKHHHSAVVHSQAMWVFGGMSDLQERSDCWKFDFGEVEMMLSVVVMTGTLSEIHLSLCGWYNVMHTMIMSKSEALPDLLGLLYKRE